MAHTHEHTHLPNNQSILAKSFWLIVLFMLIEFIAAFWTESLALLADAGHMANDAFSLGLAYLAMVFASRYPIFAKRLTLINGLSLLVIAIWIVIEAWERWQNPTTMLALPMLVIASIGLLVNLFVAYYMMQGDKQHLDMRSAYWHVLADLLGSVVAILAGIFAYFWRILWVDSVGSVLLAVLIFYQGNKIVYATWQAYHISK